MQSNHKNKYLFRIAPIFILAGLLLAGGCANIGMPSGGPRDEDPPIFVSATVSPGAVNVGKNKITLTFNELVNVKDAFSKVVVSPVSKSVPRVSSSGRNVTIEFDSLAPNTTYTVDFADAIEDNNEGNKIPAFSYTFSTGPTIDTLRIAGRVFDARNLEPRVGILVGVQSNLSDTAFSTEKLLRVAKTDDRGQFTVRGLAPGKYRVFALDDKDNDYQYSSPEEDMAFYDFIVEPTSRPVVATDTIFNILTGMVDSIVTRGRTQFLPNDILLRTFNSEIRQQYLSKYERLDSARVFLKFNTGSDILPDISVIGHDDLDSIGILESSLKQDSLVFWLRPELMKMDSLQLAVSYYRSDPQMVTTFVNDTLNFYTKKQAPKKNVNKKRRVSAEDSISAITTKLEVKSNSLQEVNQPVYFESPLPLLNFNPEAVHLSVMQDTVYIPVKGDFNVTVADGGNPRRYAVDFPWGYGEKYKLEIDTVAGVDIYGKPTRPVAYEFKTRAADEYSSILLQLTGLGNSPAFVELLNGSDAVVRAVPVSPSGEAYFPYLLPGKYYARVVMDYNGNEKYDTGNYALGSQPEVSYYYPKAVNLKKNWDISERWNVFAVPIDQMKPAAILKNKPKTNPKARNTKKTVDEEEDEEIYDPTRNPFAR